jgi:hypothetical protein
VCYRRKGFDKFLHSVIREEEGGADLTMLSVLARHDMDPWEAAEQLTRILLSASTDPRRGGKAGGI